MGSPVPPRVRGRRQRIHRHCRRFGTGRSGVLRRRLQAARLATPASRSLSVLQRLPRRLPSHQEGPMTPRRPFLDILNSLPLIKAALAGALALAPLFLPDRLIPEQLSALRVISTIVVIIAVFVGWKYHRGLRKRLGTFIVTGAVALIGLTIMQLLYVEAFVGIGQPPETEYHLIGYAVSPAGEAML